MCTKIEGCFVMDTNVGPVCIINSNLVDPKVFNIFKYFLNQFNESHGIVSILFRTDGYPELSDDGYTTWVYQPDSLSVVCNIKDCIRSAIDLTRNSDDSLKSLSIKGQVWQNIIQGLFHEVHHAQSYMYNRPELDRSITARQIEEDEAREFEAEKLSEIAKEIDIEPILGEYIDNMIYQYYSEEKADIEHLIKVVDNTVDQDTDEWRAKNEEAECGERWITLQDHMMRVNSYWYTDGGGELDDGIPMEITSFKECVCDLSNGDITDSEWSKSTIGIPLNESYTPAPNVDGVYPTPEPPTTPAAVVTPPPPPTTTITTTATATATITPPPPAQTQEVYQAPTPSATNNTVEEEYGGMYEDDDWGEEGDQASCQAPAQTTTNVQQGGFSGNRYTNSPVSTQQKTPQQGKFMDPKQETTSAPQNTTTTANAQNTNTAPLTGQQMGQTMQGLYRKLFDHIFLGCGWDKTGFQDKDQIRQPLELSPNENRVITSMITQNERGAYLEVAADGFISGKIMDRDKLLPGYEIKFVDHNGNKATRKLLPQNPNKCRKDGKLSYTADLAQHGFEIMWIINPDEKDRQFSKKMTRDPKTPTIVKMECNNNGKWE